MRTGFSVRRLLVALDLSASARSALPEALRLAGRLHADTEGLFVEDARMVAICADQGLPARHVNSITGLPETLDASTMESGLRAQSAMLLHHVSATAAALGCACNLRTVRGLVAETLIAETDQDDLLVLSRRPGHVGAVLAATATRVSAPLLILPPGERPGMGRIVVFADDQDFLERALAAAQRFRNDGDRKVEVFLAPAVSGAEAETLAQSISLPMRISSASDGTDLSELVTSDTGLVIVSPENVALSGKHLTQFLERVSKPILLMK